MWREACKQVQYFEFVPISRLVSRQKATYELAKVGTRAKAA